MSGRGIDGSLKSVVLNQISLLFTLYPLLITLKDNESLYVHPEARVFTTVYAKNAENIHIFGGGILNNRCM